MKEYKVAKSVAESFLAARKPSKREQQELVEAYALKLFSAQKDAPFKVQQKYHDKFQKKANRFSEKYLDGDLLSLANMEQLRRAAEKWWHKRLNKGPGVDW